MPDVLLFGATGYTGRLTAAALARRGAKFVVAGRDPAKLERLASDVGASDARVVRVGDTQGLVSALSDVRALVTCVGPFAELGHTALDAALQAGVNYIDSTGETAFIARVIARGADAERAGIVLAPAMGFDEVPADVVATLATTGLGSCELTLTYAFPRAASHGTLRTILTNVVTSGAPWFENGSARSIRPAAVTRWAPMPPPLGPKHAVSFGVGEVLLAPLHLDVSSVRTFITMPQHQALLTRFGAPVAAAVLGRGRMNGVLERVLPTGGGPDAATRQRSRFTVLAEARAADRRRAAAVTGVDVYGLTAETLSAAAVEMAKPGYDRTGVLSPVGAIGLETLQDVLAGCGASIEVFPHG